MTYTIVWDGSMRTPIPGIGGGEYRGSYLYQCANRGADTTDEKPGHKLRRVRCSCGNLMRLTTDSKVSKCWKCRKAHAIQPWKGPYTRRVA